MSQQSIAKKPFMTWKEAAVVVLILAVFIAALVPAVRTARVAALRAERRNNLRQIGLAFDNFYDTYKQLPQAVVTDESGRPLSSWRFRILPWMEAVMRDIDYGLPWDDPAHEFFRSHGCLYFCSEYGQKGPERLYTNVVAVTGLGTAFDAERETAFSELPDDLILVIEVPTTTIHWMQPGDIQVDDIDESVLRGPDGGGIHVLFKDGSVVFLPSDTPIEQVKWFLMIEGARAHDREEIVQLADPGRND